MATPLADRLSAVIERYDLLQHPFYQAWSAGTLPVDALKTYASEYGAFINRVAAGWAAHGDEEIAAEEREHADLWAEFAGALGTDVKGASLPAVTDMANRVDAAFADAVTSLGGLYAFECQQPNTSKSKLEGLDTHYTGLPEAARTYFEIHVNDIHEPALLLQRMEALSADDQDRAVAACESVAEGLWNALTDIHKVHCA